MIKGDGSSLGWIMNLPVNRIYGQVQNIEQVAIEYGVILVYAPESMPSSTGPDWDWFVIMPETNVEIGFEEEDEFLQYLQGYDIKAPAWIEVDDAFNEFVETGCLNWIPNCMPWQ
jgi:hypothetical protein